MIKASALSLSKRRLIYGKGINDANYVVKPTINGKVQPCPYYTVWNNMLVRCYSKSYLSRHPTYEGCVVSDDWLVFSNFRTWMETQDWKSKVLDKDILKQGNKVYSKDTCLFVTVEINNLLTDIRASKGSCSLGVCFIKKSGNFEAKGFKRGSKVHLGLFPTELEAATAYLRHKKEHIIEIALEQTNLKLRQALLARAGVM